MSRWVSRLMLGGWWREGWVAAELNVWMNDRREDGWVDRCTHQLAGLWTSLAKLAGLSLWLAHVTGLLGMC